MLSGQEISFADSLMIGVSGLAVVMLELALIAIFVFVLSKMINSMGLGGDKKKVEPAPTIQQPAAIPTQPAQILDFTEEDLPAIVCTICEENGTAPEQIVFTSITKKY